MCLCPHRSNRFTSDKATEIAVVQQMAKDAGAFDAVLSNHWGLGGAGAKDLALAVEAACKTNKRSDFKFLYPLDMPVAEKIETIAKSIYGARAVEYARVGTAGKFCVCFGILSRVLRTRDVSSAWHFFPPLCLSSHHASLFLIDFCHLYSLFNVHHVMCFPLPPTPFRSPFAFAFASALDRRPTGSVPRHWRRSSSTRPQGLATCPSAWPRRTCL
jgi:hypothetical protein